jgi:hypothetical protein
MDAAAFPYIVEHRSEAGATGCRDSTGYAFILELTVEGLTVGQGRTLSVNRLAVAAGTVVSDLAHGGGS